MKKLLLIIVLILFSFSVANAATLLFKTGWEDDVVIVPSTSTYNFVSGVDSGTSDTVPDDMPGRFRVLGTYKPYFNIVESDIDYTDCDITDSVGPDGSKALKVRTLDGSNSNTRVQLVVTNENSGETYDSMNQTSTLWWMKWDAVPVDASKTWFMFQEWRNAGADQRLYFYWSGGKAVWTYQSDTYGNNVATNNTIDVPTDEWFQMKTFFKKNSNTSVTLVLKIKRIGEAEEEIFNDTYTITDSGSPAMSGDITSYMPIKHYGADYVVTTRENTAWYDDFAWYSSSGSTDLPAWYSEPGTNYKITNASPADNATGIDVDADLSWTNSASAVTVDVYYEEISGACDLQVGDRISTGSLVATVEQGTMSYDTEVCWRVDTVHAGGTDTGTTYTFTTEPTPPEKAATIGTGTIDGTIGTGTIDITIQ